MQVRGSDWQRLERRWILGLKTRYRMTENKQKQRT